MNSVVRNWLIMAFTLLLLTAADNLLAGTGFDGFTYFILVMGWWAVALVALADGVRRALGRSSLLGQGRGFNRLLALVQIGLTALLVANLLSPLM